MRYTEKCEHCKHWIRYDASRFECACALSGFNCVFEGRDGWRPKTYTELEKENVELKERLKEHESVGNAQFWENVWSWKTKADQLTKAKDIMKRLVDLSNSSRSLLGGTWHEIVREAEDFLKEDSISEHIQRATHNYM